MNKVENRWTWGNVVTMLGTLVTMLTIIGVAYAWGQSWGEMNRRVMALETSSIQSAADSRALIEVRSDVAYIRRALDRLMNGVGSASFSDTCPADRPIFVSSHCRSSPGQDILSPRSQ